MASLYTPAPKTQGLDWLAGMVRDGQQLWQRERSLAQEAQRLQIAKEAQRLQAEQFWAQQARLAEQQEFQDRMFKYKIGDDHRKYARDVLEKDRTYKLDLARERRYTDQEMWDRNPQNPDNRRTEGLIRASEIEAQLNQQRIDKGNRPPIWGGQAPTAPPFGPDDINNPTGPFTPEDFAAPPASASAAPLPPVNQYTVPDGLPTGETKEAGTGFLNLTGATQSAPATPAAPAAPAAPATSLPPGAKATATGNPLAPLVWALPDGRRATLVAAQTDDNGYPMSFRVEIEDVGTTKKIDDPRKFHDDIINDKTRQIAALVRAREASPVVSGEAVNAGEVYKQRMEEVKAANKVTDAQIAQLEQEVADERVRRRLLDVQFEGLKFTPEFSAQFPTIMGKIQAKDVEGLRADIPGLKVLADKGDPTAKYMLGVMEKVFGTKVEDKPATYMQKTDDGAPSNGTP